MSKQSATSVNQVSNVRIQSLLKLKNDFKTDNPEQKSGYDLRIYRDPADSKLYYPYAFSKTLSHNATTGFPLKEDVDKLITAIESGELSDINAVPRDASATRKLENLSAGSNFNLGGAEASTLIDPIPKLVADSERQMFEMGEVYSLSLLRDVTFLNIENGVNPTATNHITYLNGFTDKGDAPTDGMGNITPKLLHRGHQVGCEIGPYVSQYLYQQFNYGNIVIDQKYNSEADVEGTTVLADWIRIQNGENHLPASVVTPNRAISCPRELGSIVHNDPLYQFYYNAALISFQNGIGSEFGGSTNNSAWISAGGPSILESVASVSVEALQAAWFQKYNVNLHIRPEVLAQRIDDIFNESPGSALLTDCPGYSTIRGFVDSQLNLLLAEVRAANTSNTNLLKLQYPEGSPTHPSQPAGHSLVAGACTTVLKAMLNTVDTSGATPTSILWPGSVLHSNDSVNIVAYPNDSTGMSINGELNKLASNVSLARNMAGVHYRSDAALDLGEEVAIAHLINKSRTYHEAYNGEFQGFTLQRFNGVYVRITADGVVNL